MTELSGGAAWIDGEIVPVREARIPILDTGFVRSDLTYDVVSVWDGAFFRLDDHLERFERNWRRIRLSPPLDRGGIRDLLVDLTARTGLREAYVAAILTRGVPAPGERDPRRFENRFYAYAIPYVWIARPELQHEGVHVAIARETVRIPPSAVDPQVKNFHWGDLMRGLYEAYDRGAYLGLLTDGQGNVTEGPGFNVFAVSGDTLRTPETGVFDGMTRRTVLELAAEQGLRAVVGPTPVEAVASADEIFLTSTAGGIMPVTTLDSARVGDGTPGPLTRRLRDLYWEAHREERFRTAVPYATAEASS